MLSHPASGIARCAREPCFGTDKKHPYRNTVVVKGKNGLGLFLYKIADCVRTASRPRNIAALCLFSPVVTIIAPMLITYVPTLPLAPLAPSKP